MNLIGLPVNDDRIETVSDIMKISGGTVPSIIVLVDGVYQLVASPGDPADGEVAGDVAYLVNASAIAVPIPVTGDGWDELVMQLVQRQSRSLDTRLITRHRPWLSTVPSLTKSLDSPEKGSVSR